MFPWSSSPKEIKPEEMSNDAIVDKMYTTESLFSSYGITEIDRYQDIMANPALDFNKTEGVDPYLLSMGYVKLKNYDYKFNADFELYQKLKAEAQKRGLVIGTAKGNAMARVLTDVEKQTILSMSQELTEYERGLQRLKNKKIQEALQEYDDDMQSAERARQNFVTERMSEVPSYLDDKFKQSAQQAFEAVADQSFQESATQAANSLQETIAFEEQYSNQRYQDTLGSLQSAINQDQPVDYKDLNTLYGLQGGRYEPTTGRAVQDFAVDNWDLALFFIPAGTIAKGASWISKLRSGRYVRILEGGKIEALTEEQAMKMMADVKKIETAKAGKDGVAIAGEPVSVATGEYVETWDDFSIPGTLALSGARFMGMQTQGSGPLGPHQTSAFDIAFRPGERGFVVLHDAKGVESVFARPRGLSPSVNPAYPHLKLSAPWLKQLKLEDRGAILLFRQYKDKTYYLESVEDRSGNRAVFQRTDRGLLERIDHPDGLALLFTNDARGLRTGVSLQGIDGSTAELARYTYDAQGWMTEAACAHGLSARYEWDERGRLSRWRNFSKRTRTDFTYDDADRVIHTATSGLWNDDRFIYDSENRHTTYIPAGDEGRAERFAYDDAFNVTEHADPLGNTTRTAYDAAGFRTALTDPLERTTAWTYDPDGNVRTVRDAEGRRTRYSWGLHGTLERLIDGAGNMHAFDHDVEGRLLAAVDAEGQRTELEWTSNGLLAQVRFADGSVETRTYDSHNRLIAVTDAKGAQTRLAYDAFGRLSTLTDALGQTTALFYDGKAESFHTPTRIRRPDGAEVSRTFDADGAQTAFTDALGRT